MSFEYGQDLVAIGDTQWLKHAVLNVIDNAIKYTPDGGSVTVRCTHAGKHVLIEVSDTGIGIPPEALPHIFERFFRGESARTDSVEGVGLGLNLAKGLSVTTAVT